eukprot:4557135-Prymnesium_polylepis.1
MRRRGIELRAIRISVLVPPRCRARRLARSLAHVEVLDNRRRRAPRGRRPHRRRLARRTAR